MEFILHPHLLKEFRNRRFLFGSRHDDIKLYNPALDRLVSFEVVDDIQYCNNPDFDSVHFFDDVIDVSKNIGDRPVPNQKIYRKNYRPLAQPTDF